MGVFGRWLLVFICHPHERTTLARHHLYVTVLLFDMFHGQCQ